MTDADRIVIPDGSELAVMDRRYDVRIARRIADLQAQIDALEARVTDLE